MGISPSFRQCGQPAHAAAIFKLAQLPALEGTSSLCWRRVRESRQSQDYRYYLYFPHWGNPRWVKSLDTHE